MKVHYKRETCRKSLFYGVDNYIINLHILIFGEHYN